MNLSVFPRVLKALLYWPFAKSRIENPRLIMTLLVKNEGEKLEKNLLFHKAMGVDAFVITDNNSTDGTRDIIRQYQEKGWVAEVIDEPATGYEQKQWVDRMIDHACKYHGADWIINADADELWYAPSGNLKEELARCPKRIARCSVFSMYPEEGVPFYQWTHRIIPVSAEQREQYDLSPYSVFNRQTHKVGHRATGYLQISMGNHKVKMLPPTSCQSNIIVYHYNIGNRDAFMKKMIQGGRELEQHKGRHGGRHWRYFYQIYKEGSLSGEYDRVIGTAHYDQLVADGHIVEDTTVRDIFVHHKLGVN